MKRVRAIIARQAVRESLLLAGANIIAALAFYAPFLMRLSSIAGIPFNRRSMDAVYGMWDGPLWVTTAATLYDPNRHNPLYAWFTAPPKDYAERFPLYPLLIRALSPLTGYWKAGLVISIAASILVSIAIYIIIRRLGSVGDGAAHLGLTLPFWSAFVLIFWTPRNFLYHYVIMAEPLTTLGLIMAAYFFTTRRYGLSAIGAALVVASRPNGFTILPGVAILFLWAFHRAFQGRRYLETCRTLALLLPLFVLFGILYWYKLRFHNALAMLDTSNFVVPRGGLFPYFTASHPGEQGAAYSFLLILVGIVELIRRRLWSCAILTLSLYIPTFLVGTDIDRFLIPVLPLAFGLAGDRILSARSTLIALPFTVPIVYAYSWGAMLSPNYQAAFAHLRALLP